MHKMHKIAYDFCKRKFLIKKHIIKVKSNENREYIYLEDPLVLARLAGHLKHNIGQPNKGYQIFIRGQSDDFPGMIPSIFRKLEKMSNNFKNRLKAYDDLISEIQRIEGLKRFKGKIGGAILQHYGIRTPWIDVVDNLFVALWFATRERSQKEPFIYKKKKSKDYGWVYFIQVESPQNIQDDEGIVKGNNTMWCDLRCYQTSLTLRAHTQHGIFVSRTNYNESNYDLNDFIVATVKFPINSAFISLIDDFNILSMQYMFPSSYYDNTYKILRSNAISNLIHDVERRNNLVEGELGRINKYISKEE